MRASTAAVSLILVAVIQCVGFAATLYVSPAGSDTFGDGTQGNPFRTIQEGIRRARAGDVVEAAEGIYEENLSFLGRAVTLSSADPSDAAVVAATIIDGGASGSVITFDHGETARSVVSGFTIQNGSADEGAGIYCRNSSPTISMCVISGNVATSSYYSGGGGVCCRGGAATIDRCTITGNTGFMGGGIGCFMSSRATSIADCVISENRALSGGGGVCFLAADGRVDDCVIADNLSAPDWDGGGILCQWDADVAVTGCEISGNTANGGGGIAANEAFSVGGMPRIVVADSAITGNRAVYPTDGPGGGVSVLMGVAVLTRTRICGNMAEGSGGGVCARNGIALLTNCTVDQNACENGWGGGVAGGENSFTQLWNSIVTGNRGPEGPQVALYHSNGVMYTAYSDVEGGPGGVYDSASNTVLEWLFDNFDEDPLFAAPGSWDDNGTPADIWDDTWQDGDYHLQSVAGRWDPAAAGGLGAWVSDAVYSPCIDKGDPFFGYGLEPAPNGNRLNLGAFGGTASASMSPSYGADAIAALTVANSHPLVADEAVWPDEDWPPVFFWVINDLQATVFSIDVSTDATFTLTDARHLVTLKGDKGRPNTCTPSAGQWRRIRRLALVGDGTLYWRVTACDAARGVIFTSDAMTLLVDPGTWAVDALDLLAQEPQVTWTHEAEGYTRYKVQFSVDADFRASARYTLTVPAGGVAGSPLRLSTASLAALRRFAVRNGLDTLYYRVRAQDANSAFLSWSDAATVEMP